MRVILFILILLTIKPIEVFSQNYISDIIKPIKLVSGKEKQINLSDLFYSENYDLKFYENKNLLIKKINRDSVSVTSNSNFEGITVIDFKIDMNTYSIPVISKKEKLYKFTFKPEKKFDNIFLFGSFNGWNRQDIHMTDHDNDGIYEAEVALEPGIYQYKFFADGNEIVDYENPVKVPNGFGDFNSVRTISEEKENKLFLHVDKYEKSASKIFLSYFVEGIDKDKKLNLDNIYGFIDNQLIHKENILLQENRIIIQLDKEKIIGKKTIRIICSNDGNVSNIQEQILFDGTPANTNNFTWNNGIIYSILIDRFNDGDKSINAPIKFDSLDQKANYFGGDFQGIIDKINENYFDSLGINTIWISPVYDNPEIAFKEYPAPHRYYSGYHGYWPISSVQVENRFGSMNKLKELINTAHTHGIKVLLDFVSNHVHKDHPYFKEHREWFGKLELPDGRLNLRLWDEYRLTTWFEPYLPSFDYEGSKDALETMTDNAVWWLKETGADGFRHDAVKHVPNIFWRTLTQKLKKNITPFREVDIYQIGETFGSYDLISSYVNNGQLSSQFNFNLYDVALPTFIQSNSSFDGLDKEMHKTFSVYGNLHLMGNIMDSHDKNRFMSFADGDLDVSQWSAAEVGWSNPPVVDNPDNYKKLILYMAYMNSIPGLPVIYYGSEFGMSGASDPDNRRMMRFGNQLSKFEKNTLNSVKKIINIRKNHPALSYGDFYTLRADSSIYSYLRSDFNERILIVINKSSNKKHFEISLPNEYQITNGNSLIDESKVEFVNNKSEIEMDGKSYNFFLLK
jgi:glycosidase